MLNKDRHQEILAILNEKRTVSVDYLSKTLYISASTVRRDLRILENQGFLHHHYGNVSLIDEASKALPIELRKTEMLSAKTLMGKKATELVSDGDVLLVDSSSTCLRLIENLGKFERLTVITYGLQALELLKSMNINTYCTGGRLLKNSMAFIGSFAESALRQIQVDKYFFSASGLSDEGVISDGGEQENRLHRLMLEQNCKKIFMCDSSKFGARYMFCAGTLEDTDYIVTDKNVYERVSRPTEGRGALALAST